MLNLLLATALITSLNTKSASGAAQGALHLTALADLCKAAKAGKTLSTLLTTRINKLTGWQAEYSLFSRKIGAMQLLQTKPSIQLNSLKAYGQIALKAIETEMAELTKLSPDASAKAAYAAGLIDDFVTIFTSTRDTTGTSNVCIIKGGGDNEKLEDADLNGCLETKVGADATRTELNTLAMKSFNFGGKQTLTTSKTCKLTTSDGSGYSSGTASQLKPANWGGGVLKVTHTGSEAALTAAKATLTAHEATRAAAEKLQSVIKATEYKAVTTAEDLRALLIADRPDETMQQAVKIATNRQQDVGYAATRADVEKIFGFTGSPDDVVFIKSLDEYKVPIQENSQTKQTEVMKLTAAQIDEGERAALRQNQQLVAKAEGGKVCDSADKKPTENICTKITNKNECDNKPYCSYTESAAEGDKKCQFNETKATENGVPATQAQAAAAEAKTDKCKDKGEKDCKDGCKWEGETCKDSSLLVSKKFALSVVSAAFAALLF